MSKRNGESKFVCWTGIICFVLLALGLFYYFFIQQTTKLNNVNNNDGDNDYGINNNDKININKININLTKEEAELRANLLVDKINNHPDNTWIAELNPYAIGLATLDQKIFAIPNGSVDTEIYRVLNEMNDVIKGDLFMDYYDKHITELMKIDHIPSHFDAAEYWPQCSESINEIHDQGGCGSCWSVAAASLITDRICIKTNGLDKKKISPQDLLECCYFCGGCNGTLDPFTPFIYWYQHGIHTSDCYPYTISTDCGYPCLPDTFLNPKGLGKCKGRKLCRKPGEQAKYVYRIGSIYQSNGQRSLVDAYYDKYNDNITTVELLKREMIIHGPAVLCFNVFEGFMHYKQGVYNVLKNAEGAHIYDHCVKITGWDIDKRTGKEFLKAINSWSKQWATDGTFNIELEMLHHFRSDLYAGIPRIY